MSSIFVRIDDCLVNVDDISVVVERGKNVAICMRGDFEGNYMIPAAIDVVKTYLTDCQIDDADWHGNGVEYELESLPSAQPDLSEYSDKLWRKAYERGKRDALVEPQWIQCSERLPEMNRSILIANSQGWTAEGEYVGEYDGHRKWVQYRWSATLWDDEVLAWMPLPDLYEGEQNE